MKLISYREMPKKYFDICDARKCPKEARNLVTIHSKGDGETDLQQYSFCDKHLQQFKDEARVIKC